MRPERQIAIAGYLGARNMGDEGILEALLVDLGSTGVERVVVLSEDPDYTRGMFPHVGVAPALPTGPRSTVAGLLKGRLLPSLAALRRSYVLVIAGGTAVADTQFRVIGGLFWRVCLARVLGCRIALYGIGTGNLTTWAGKLMARLVFRLSRAATLREPQAVEKLNRAGVDCSRLSVTADPVINLRPAPPPANAEIPVSASPGQSRLVGFALPAFLHDPQRHRNMNRARETFRAAMADLADRFAAEGAMDVAFLPMQTPCDVRMARSIRARMTRPSILIEGDCRPSQVMGIIGQFHLLVGMRLHSMIMAAAMGVPWLAIAYADKVDYFNEMMDMSEYSESYRIWTDAECPLDPARLWDRYLALERDYEAVRNRIRDRAREWQGAERGNLELLSRVLGQ